MKEQFVTYEIALALKELGFNEECMGLYYKTEFKLADFISLPYVKNSELNNKYVITAPLWQQVIDWLREKHNISISVAHYGVYGHAFSINFIDNRNFSINPEYNNMTYPKAREQAISKAIELCKKQ